MALCRKLYPERVHPVIVISYSNLAAAKYGIGEFLKAIVYFEKSLAIYLKLYPEGVNLYVLESYRNLIAVWRQAGNAVRAKEYEMKAQALEPKLKRVNDEITLSSIRRDLCSSYDSHRLVANVANSRLVDFCAAEQSHSTGYCE